MGSYRSNKIDGEYPPRSGSEDTLFISRVTHLLHGDCVINAFVICSDWSAPAPPSWRPDSSRLIHSGVSAAVVGNSYGFAVNIDWLRINLLIATDLNTNIGKYNAQDEEQDGDEVVVCVVVVKNGEAVSVDECCITKANECKLEERFLFRHLQHLRYPRFLLLLWMLDSTQRDAWSACD